MGIWRVGRILSGFSELRFSLEAPKVLSARKLVFSHRLVNASWKRSFSIECAELSLVKRISREEEARIDEMLKSSPPLKKAFAKYQSKNGSVDLAVNVSLGLPPGSDREKLRAACDSHLGASIETGMTIDEVLAALRTAGYYDCIGKTPISATIQLISRGHEVRDGEFILRYNRLLGF